MTTKEKIKAKIAELEEKKKQFIIELREDFPKLFTELFAKSENIKSIGWVQYVPYFNDGDECVLTVDHYDLYVNGKDPNEDWDEDDYDEDEERIELNDEDEKIITEFEETLGEVPDEFYRDLFGTDVKVTIFVDGTIDTEDYDSHD